MQAKYAIRNDCRHGQVVEGVREILPDVCIAVLAKALVVETIDLRDLATLVVAAENSDSAAVANLKGYQQSDSFQ